MEFISQKFFPYSHEFMKIILNPALIIAVIDGKDEVEEEKHTKKEVKYKKYGICSVDIE